MRAHEANLFALGHEQLAEKIDTEGDQAIQSALAGARILKAEIDTIKTLTLCMQRNARMYEAALKQLLHLQATRKAEEEVQMKQAVAIAQTSAAAKTAFHPFNFGFDLPLAKIEMQLRRENALKRAKTASSAA